MAALRYWRVIERAVELLFPSTCPVCNKRSEGRATLPICTACWSRIKPLTGNLCMLCCLPLSNKDITLCGQCYTNPPFYSEMLAYGVYDGVLKEAVHSLKFDSIRRLAIPLGSLLNTMDIQQADLIVPVPLTKKRLKERGFNQSLLLASEISKRLRIPLGYSLLIKIKETHSQAKLKRKDRLISLKGAFKVTQYISGQTLLLVDDVLTTGTTLNECARELRLAGAKEVRAVVVAKTMPLTVR